MATIITPQIYPNAKTKSKLKENIVKSFVINHLSHWFWTGFEGCIDDRPGGGQECRQAPVPGGVPVEKFSLNMMNWLRSWRLWRRKECLALTWRGWLLILAVFLAIVVPVFRNLHAFLAVTDRQPDGVLVIEGWAQDYALEAAVKELRAKGGGRIYVVGGPLEHGAALAQYRTFSEMAAAALIKLSLATNEVQAVPAPLVAQDRTYTAALALKKWWHENGGPPSRMELISVGPHARRSRLMFQKAFGDETKVGIISVPPWDYDPRHWWRTSAGVRVVVDETVAYLYARLLFHP